MSLSLLAEKVIILFVMLVTTVCFGVIPKWLVSRIVIEGNSSKWRKILGLMSCFSGGVFVAACMLDLLPDVRESIENVLKEVKKAYEVEIDFPVAEFIMCVGFFLVLFIEQSVLVCGGNLAHSQGSSSDSQGVIGHSHVPQNESRPLISEASRSHSSHGTFGSNDHEPDEPDGEHQHAHDHILQHSSLRSILLLIALSFHSLFEGLAIGLQEDVSELVSIFLAVIIHKCIMAFSLGLTMAQSSLTSRNFYLSVLIFSVASPIGMGVGIGLADLKQSLSRDIANGILQGLAGGTFLYITFFEVLPHELTIPQNRLLRVFSVVLGFTCICCLILFAG